ncbi:MAG: FMN-binding protein [Clostridiales bacterium]|nr:FMN-binding protein [Clostridiales bacterium]
MSKIKPTLVLVTITIVICTLLIVAHNATYVDTSNIITEDLQEALNEIYEDKDFKIVSDWSELGYTEEIPKEIEKLVINQKNQIAFQLTVDAYNKDGISMVVGIENNKVKGVKFLQISDSPGIGTKIDNEDFLKQFLGKDSAVEVSKNPTSENQIDTVSGATYSSKGAANGVNLAIETAKKLKVGGK